MCDDACCATISRDIATCACCVCVYDKYKNRLRIKCTVVQFVPADVETAALQVTTASKK
jgi:hypothetical protein